MTGKSNTLFMQSKEKEERFKSISNQGRYVWKFIYGQSLFSQSIVYQSFFTERLHLSYVFS